MLCMHNCGPRQVYSSGQIFSTIYFLPSGRQKRVRNTENKRKGKKQRTVLRFAVYAGTSVDLAQLGEDFRGGACLGAVHHAAMAG
jgi:hypothetical protein